MFSVTAKVQLASLLISGFVRARRLTLRTTLRVSFVGSLLSLLVGSFIFLDTRYHGIFFTSMCCMVEGNRFEQLGDGILVAYLLTGIAVIPLVAQSVAHDTSTEMFQFVQLTGITNAKIIKGYFWGALVRLHLLIMFMIISMPFALLFLLRNEIEMRAYEFEQCLNSISPPSCINSSYLNLADLPTHYLLMNMLNVMELWGMLLAGISLGIAIGLIVRRRVAAILFSVVAIICILRFVLRDRPIPVEIDLVNHVWPYGVTILVLFLPQVWARLSRNYRAI